MTVTGVYTDECPKLSDGRVKHWFVRQDGVFVCLNCGSPADLQNPWGGER